MRNISPMLKGVIFTGLFFVPFIPFLVSSSFFFPFITTKAFAWRIIIEIVFAAWMLLALSNPLYRPKKSLISYAVFVFLVVVGLADLLGAEPYRSFWSNFERMEGYVTMLHLGMFFLVISSVFNEVNWKRWWNTTLAASGLMVIYALSQLAGIATINQGGVRVDGTLGNASYLAVYMLIHIFIVILLMWRSRKDATLRWTYLLLIFGQMFILYHTATRGAIFGLLGGLLVMALLNIRNKEEAGIRKASIWIISVLVLMVTGFVLLRESSFVQNSPVLERFADISTEELKSGGRSFVWPMAFKGVGERPIFGWGQENFGYVFQKHYDPGMYQLEPWFDRAHNIFLDWMVSGGILGLLAYLALYIVALYLIWRRDQNLSHSEKSILTGLLAAYFFHNFFVFDNLISYISFFALLAYMYSRNTPTNLPLNKGEVPKAEGVKITAPIIIAALLFTLYFVNIKPIRANTALIEALKAIQLNDPAKAVTNFKEAYRLSGFGRMEIIEQASYRLETIAASSLSIEDKNEFLSFMKDAITSHALQFPDIARAQILAGSFFFKIGSLDESLKYLLRAEELSPGKQPIKFEIAEAYLYKGEFDKALDAARRAYELDPTYAEAQFTYAVTAIYAGDRELENRLKDRIYQGDAQLESEAKKVGSSVDLERWVTSDLITLAYIKVGRQTEAVNLLKRRLEREPAQLQNYISLASVYLEIGDRASAIQTLRELSIALPESKAQAEEYIKQIQEGKI